MKNLVDITSSKINEKLTSFFLQPPDLEVLPLEHHNKVILESQSSRIIEISKLSKCKTSPSDNASFSKRLKSFKMELWNANKISPLLCSSYGWFLKEKNLLQCVTCSASLCSVLPAIIKDEVYLKSLELFKDRLISSHFKWCGWPNNPSIDDFMHPPIILKSNYLIQLSIHASKFAEMREKLPYINTTDLFEQLVLTVQELILLFGRNVELQNFHIAAGLLVLTGWQFESKQKIKCSLCLRSVGLWNFLPLNEEQNFTQSQKLFEDRQKILEVKKVEKEKREEVRNNKRLLRDKKIKEKIELEIKVKKEKEKAAKVKEALEKLDKIDHTDIFLVSDMNDISPEDEESLLSVPDVEAKNITLTQTPDILIIKKSESVLKFSCQNVSLIKNSFFTRNTDPFLSSEHNEINESQSSGKILNSEYLSDDSNCSLASKQSENDLWLEAVGGINKNLAADNYGTLSMFGDSQGNDTLNFDNKNQENIEEEGDLEKETDLELAKDEMVTDFKKTETNSVLKNDETNSDIEMAETCESKNVETNSDIEMAETCESKNVDTNLEKAAKVNLYSNEETFAVTDSDLKDTKNGTANIDSTERCNNANVSLEKVQKVSINKEKAEETCFAAEKDVIKKDSVKKSMVEENLKKRRRSSESCAEEINREKISKVDAEDEIKKSLNSDSDYVTSDSESESDEICDDNDEYFKLKSRIFNPISNHYVGCGWISKINELHLNRIRSYPAVEGYKLLSSQFTELISRGEMTSLNPRNNDDLAESISTMRNVLDSWIVPEYYEEENDIDQSSVAAEDTLQ